MWRRTDRQVSMTPYISTFGDKHICLYHTLNICEMIERPSLTCNVDENGWMERGCKVHGRGGVEGTWTDSCNLSPHQRKSQVGHGIAEEGFSGKNWISWEVFRWKTHIQFNSNNQDYKISYRLCFLKTRIIGFCKRRWVVGWCEGSSKKVSAAFPLLPAHISPTQHLSVCRFLWRFLHLMHFLPFSCFFHTFWK